MEQKDPRSHQKQWPFLFLDRTMEVADRKIQSKDRTFYVLDGIFHAQHRNFDGKQPLLMVFHRPAYLQRGTLDLKSARLVEKSASLYAQTAAIYLQRGWLCVADKSFEGRLR